LLGEVDVMVEVGGNREEPAQERGRELAWIVYGIGASGCGKPQGCCHYTERNDGGPHSRGYHV
jgi:hypothetical protein